jgi:transposase
LTTRLEPDVRLTIGIDTHAEVHVAVALDQLGRRLATCTIPTTMAGHTALVNWAHEFGTIERIGMEGTGSYGAGLAGWLRAQGLIVLEVERPKRQLRRRRGKSDPIDAEAAARAVQAGTALGQPKTGTGRVEMIRALSLTRRSAVKARTQAINELHALVVTAPYSLRSQLRRLTVTRLVATASSFRPRQPIAATKFALKSIAVRHQQLTAEIARLDAQLARLVAEAAPALVAVKGMGTQIAAALLVAAGDNPERLHSEAAFAHLCGVAPIPASSGKTTRHRLNRGGNRQANWALYMLTIGRMGWHAPTRAYVARRTTEGLAKTDILRCLKRYIAREVYHLLVPQTAPAPVPPPRSLALETLHPAAA